MLLGIVGGEWGLENLLVTEDMKFVGTVIGICLVSFLLCVRFCVGFKWW